MTAQHLPAVLVWLSSGLKNGLRRRVRLKISTRYSPYGSKIAGVLE